MIAYAIESVLAQDFHHFEHIIVDGGSTDNTLRILNSYPHLKVLSEPDQGMYDALNKGLQIAAGEIIGFLNTDDLYADNIFHSLAREFENPDVMAVAGRAVVFRELADRKIKIVDTYSPDAMNLVECSTIGRNFFNAWFFRRSVFGQIGGFNSSYKIVGDREFMFRFALKGLRYTVIDHLVYKYRQHDESLTFDKNSQTLERSAKEHLMMTHVYLVDHRLPAEVRKLLIQLHTSEAVNLAARSLWMWNFKNFIHYSIEGSKYSIAWPLKFFQYILRMGWKRLRTKSFGIKPQGSRSWE
jgi:glycosyltransferase involved in cell wall biosynthesis